MACASELIKHLQSNSFPDQFQVTQKSHVLYRLLDSVIYLGGSFP
jgi:hypothetical protein